MKERGSPSALAPRWPQRVSTSQASASPVLTPRQQELASLLAALLVADYLADPAASVNSPAGPHRERVCPEDGR